MLDELARRAAGTVLPNQTVDALARALLPAVHELVREVHGVVDHGQEAARSVLADAAHHVDRQSAKLEHRLRRAVERTGDETRDALADARDGVVTGVRSTVDSFWDRVIAFVVACVVGYGAYVRSHAQLGEVSPAHIATLIWMSMTLVSLLTGLSWALTGRAERLRHVLVWFLYIVAMFGITAVVLIVAARMPPMPL